VQCTVDSAGIIQYSAGAVAGGLQYYSFLSAVLRRSRRGGVLFFVFVLWFVVGYVLGVRWRTGLYNAVL
jgi:hypothetical protein